MLNGEISHAVNVIIANSSASPLFGWPATGGDGTDTSGRAPAEG